MSAALPFRTETFAVLPSTQDALRERLLAGENVHGLVIRAEAQSAGRGQRRRDWHSAKGGSYQSVGVAAERLGEPSVLQPSSALVIALGLAQTLNRYGVQAGVKWPNDIYYRGKKLAGVLSEVVQQHLLIGVGVNVHNPVPEGAASLRGWDVDGVSMVVLEGVAQGLSLLQQESFSLPEAFAARDVLKGQEVTVAASGQRFVGTVQGVDELGHLCVCCQGKTRTFASARICEFKALERF